ncbi:hypothetical protein AB1Y20_007342 [Prymnesium parvum]|uniref:Ion transport domain-containing protein n=1 Tax=Prymnesium parvum TaxID=97485 RepID=A0AB34IWX3_PRYPA
MSGYVPLLEERDARSPRTESTPKQKRILNRCLAALDGLVNSVAFSSTTGTKVVAGDGKSKVTMIDTESGATLWQIELGDGVNSVAFSSITDTKVVAGDEQGKVTMLDAESGATLWQTDLGGSVYSVAFSSTTDTKVVAGDGQGKVTMLDAESGATLWQTDLGSRVFSVAFSSTTDTKVVAGEGKSKVTMLDAETGATLWKMKLGGSVLNVAFSSTTDTKVVAGDRSRTVTMLDAQSGATLWQAELGGDVFSVAFSSTTDTKVVAGDRSRKVTMLDADSSATLWQTELGGEVFSVAFSSTTDTKVVAGDDKGNVTMLDIASDATLWQKEMQGSVNAVGFSSTTDTKVVAGDGKGKVTMLDAERGAPLWQTDLDGVVQSVASSSTTDTKLVAGDEKGKLTMLDAENGATLWQKELGDGVNSVTFSFTDTKVVAGGKSGKVSMLDAESGATLWQADLDGVVQSVAFSSTTDTKVVAGDEKGKVTMLDAESGATLWQIELGKCVYSVAFSSTTDTKVVAGDTSGKVTMLDAESGATLWQTELGSRVFSVAFSSTTDTKVVAGVLLGMVTMLDAESGATLWQTKLDGWVYSVAFSSTDTKVVAGDDKGKVTLFTLVDEIMLTRIEDSLWSLHVGALCKVVPRTSLLCGTSLGGRSLATMLAQRSDAQGAVQFIEWVQQHCCDGERAAAAAALVRRDSNGSNALEYAMSTHKTAVVQAFIEFLLLYASPNTLDLLLTRRAQEPSTLERVAVSYTPLLVAALAGRLLCPYAHSGAPSISRYSAALLDADRSRVCLKGATLPADLIAQRFWDESAKEAADAVDVICGVPLLPGLTRADSSAFETIVKVADLRLIASEPMRAAIAFKWAAYGRKRWYQQVGWYAGYVGGFLGGVGLLQLTPTSIEPFDGADLGGDESADGRLVVGALLFAATSLINLVYLHEELAEVHSLGVRKYVSSLTNLNDASLHGLVLLLAPVLMVSSKSASSIAAVATVLLFLKGQKVLRGNEGMSFLVNMLYEIILDMRAFLLIQFGAVVLNAFAFRLLRGDTDTYASYSASLFSSYALLMHGEGVGELDLYMDSMLTAALLFSMTLLVDIVMLNALIAIMSDTYDRVSEARVEMGLLGQAQLLVDIEKVMNDEDRRSKDYFPKWLHVIRIKDEDGGDDGWSGRLRAIKSKIDSVEEAVQQQAGALEHMVGTVEQNILEAVEQKMSAVELKMGAVEQQVGAAEQKIVEAVKKQIVESVEQKVGAVEQRVSAVEQKMDALMQMMKDLASSSRRSAYRLGSSKFPPSGAE